MKQKQHDSAELGKKGSFRLEALEPRLLFSADAASLFAANQPVADSTFPEEPASTILAPFYQVEASSATAQEAETTTPAIDLIIIDRSLEDSDWIAEQLNSREDSSRVIEFLDSDRDGIDQISELMAKYESVSAVHIFSHGQQAELQLGNSTIDAQDLLLRADQISAWSQSLTNDADLLIYGCDLVGSEAGIEFATLLGQLTTADVAASDNLTGSSALGGDWQLEYRSGAIEADAQMGEVLLSDYSGTLATTYTVSSNLDNGAVNTLRWAIEQANTDGVDSIIKFSKSQYIQLSTALPDITSTVIIDGTDFPGAESFPEIYLIGTGASSGNALTLAAGSDGSVIKGFSIRGFTGSGILINGSDGNSITRSDIGSDGIDDYGNERYGVEIIDSKNNNIGSTTMSSGNPERLLIAGNELSGIHISGAGSTGNAINNVNIGFGWDETAIANGTGSAGEAGIYLTEGASDNFIGTTIGNAIGGNEGSGIRISGLTTTGNIVQNNMIGMDRNNLVAIANTEHGILINSNASNNTIGGLLDGEGNIISNNDGDGIRISGPNTIDNSILRNTMENNTGMAISLNGGSPTANDVDDVDSGPNNYQNNPVFTSATTDESGTLTLTASLNSQANKDYRVEFFVVDTANPTGHGGASTYLGFAIFSSGPSGNFDGTFAFGGVNIAAGSYITATATEWFGGSDYGSTSEFSANIEAVRTNSEPTFTSSESFNIEENSSAVDTVTTNDSDGDTPAYRLINTKDHSFFTIDSSTGQLSFLSPPDHENPLDSNSDNEYLLTVEVDDGYGGIVTQDISVQVDDLNDTAPTIDSAQTFSVDENSVDSSVVGTVTAVDSDSTGSITWSIIAGNTGNAFAIDTSNGEITVANTAAIDYESSQQFTLSISASDGVNANDTENVIVNINDIADEPLAAIVDIDSLINSVDENSVIGSSVGIEADTSDGDAGQTISYLLSSNPGDFFTIDAVTGKVSTAKALDRETAASHTIEVTATSTDNSTSTQSFTIQVGDVNEVDVSVISDTNSDANAVDENATAGTLAGITASASDADSTDTVSYSLSNNPDSLFAIDATSGVITVLGSLDRETAASHTIEVTATSTDNSTSTQTFTIQVGDINEVGVGVITDTNTDANAVDENATAGTLVGITASASDADSTDTVSYSLSNNPDNLFAIDATSGVVTVAVPLDRETAASHTIEVTATSSDNSTSTQSFTIQVGDVNEVDVSVISDTDSDANAVDENATVGTLVGITASASDADSTDTVSYSLSNNPDNLFAIDATSGVVTVLGSLDRETAASHTIDVTATSTDNSTSTQSFTIQVGDVSESTVSAVTDSNTDTNTVDENTAAGTLVGITASASDADSTDTVSYSLSNNPDNLFAIDTTSGVVTLVGSLDRETADSHTLEITATSTDSSTSAQLFTIQVGDINESTISAVTDSNTDTNTVDENATAGTLVGITASANDADGTDTVSYSLSNNPDSLFAIDAASGVVTVLGSLDRETAASHTIDVTATSSDNSTSTQSFTIQVGDVSESTVSAVTDSNTDTNTVDENTAAGTLVGITASASDADSTDTVSYSLSNNPDNLFAIDTASGVVTVLGSLDRETAASHTIDVTATSTDNSTSTQSFTIQVGDINEVGVGVISDTNSDTNAVDENATAGTLVGITASASDADSTDTVSYSLSNNPDNLFAIDATSGVVTVAVPLDRETAASHTIDVTATSSDNSTSTQSFTIQVGDVSESTVSAVTDSNTDTNTVDENTAAGTLVGITASASDADSTDTVSYSLSNNPDNLFAIDTASGVVTVLGSLDRETAASHTIDVTATSTDNSTSTQSFTIQVGDINEVGVGVISDTNSDTNAVDENATAGTLVGITASASDADSTDTVSYSLSNNPDNLFAIDATSGVVTVAVPLDRETAASHTIEVTATSTDNSTSTQTFTIQVRDVNESTISAITDTNADTNAVDENATAGTLVGITASASDADSTDTVSYSLSNNPDNLFAIDATSGVVTVLGSLDRETAASHTIDVTATSTDNSTSTQSFTIQVGDINEVGVGVISDTNSDTNAVDENATAGTLVGITASASDADSTDTVSYSLSNNPDNLFAIDATSGVVTVAVPLDRETADSHTIEVTATSTDNSTSTQTFTIQVRDVNESTISAITDTNADTNAVDENATAGTLVGITASASDADSTDTVSYSLSNNPDNLFAIDATSGVVTLVGSLDRETADSYTLEITATSTDNSTSTQLFTVQVGDTNEVGVGVITDTNSDANAVDETATAGTLVGITASASDADSTDTVSYSLSNNPDNLFAIDTTSGVVTVLGSLDREIAGSHTLEVTATSTDNSTSAQSFTIQVGDVNEIGVGVISDTNTGTNAVDETATAGTLVGITASASDADSTDTVSYSLSNNPDNLFAIDAMSGVITLLGSLDREIAGSHTLEVTATSTDSSTSTQLFTIQVGDVNESTISAVTDSNTDTNTIDENTAAGTVVGITASASDADSTDTVSYSLSNNPDNLFAIDATSGVVTLVGSLDRETATSHTIEVTATSTDNSTSTQLFTVQVGDINEVGVGVISDTNSDTNAVDENATAGTLVGITASASDADSTDTVSYSLSNNPDNLFAIDATSGVVTVLGSLDRETAASHTIEVTATSSDNSTSTQSFTIQVGDVNESTISAITDTNADTNAVDENATAGTVVGITASASDADSTDTVSYSLSNNPDSLFAIDATSGVVTVLGSLDRETAASHTIEVTATSSDNSTSTQSFTIQVRDVNESTISAITDTNADTNAVDENATAGTLVGITASASDADSTDTVSYSLSNNPDNLFAIDATSGVVTVAVPLDRETAASHTIEITATSTDNSTSTQSFTIQVGDVNESTINAVTDSNTDTNTVDENTAAGTVVGITASASDADSTDTVSYSLSNNPDNLFAIDAVSGVVTVLGSLDRETAASHTIEVTATSTDNSTSTQSFTIQVGDINESTISAITDSNTDTNTVDENAIVGTSVGITASASDADTTDTVSYSLSNNPDNLFAIDAASGVVTVLGSLDRETAASHTIEVTATSTDNSTSAQSFTIQVGDVNESTISAITDSNTDTNTVDENATAGTLVGITASANDADSTNTVSYSLSNNPDNLFAIDATSGVVTLVGSLDRETATSHTIEVTATSTDNSTSTQSFTIQVGDVNESTISAITDIDSAGNTVAKNAAAGTTVGITAKATDADSSNDAITYSLSNNAAGLFSIDSHTGIVTLAETLIGNSDFSYTIEVTALSADNSSSSRTFVVSIDSNNSAPDFVSSETFVIPESHSEVGIVTASDREGDSIHYSISGGSDAAQFNIDETTGLLSFKISPDFEAPTDASNSNRYEITVMATDARGSATTQSILVKVTDINLAPTLSTTEMSSSPRFTGVIGQVQIFDPDLSDQVTLKIIGGNAQPYFTYDAQTSQLSQNQELQQGRYSLEVMLIDSEGNAMQATLSIIILADPVLAEATPDLQILPDSVDSNILLNKDSEHQPLPDSKVAKGDTNGMLPNEAENSVDSADEVGEEGEAFEYNQPFEDVWGESAHEDSTNDSDFLGSESSLQTTSNTHHSNSETESSQNKILNILESIKTRGLVTTNLVIEGYDFTPFTLTLTPLNSGGMDTLSQDLEESQVREQQHETTVLAIGGAASVALTAGFVTWMFKAGLLLSAAKTSAPLWSAIDPVPILRSRGSVVDDESDEIFN